MRKLFLPLLMVVLCLGLFTACGGDDGASVPGSTDTGSSGGSYDGWEVIDPIENGGDYTFND